MPPTSERLKDYRKKKVRKEVYFTKAEISDFKKVADQEGENVGVVIRNMAVAYLHKRPALNLKQKAKLEAIEIELENMTLLVRSIANDINQIARKSERIDSLIDENDLLGHLKALDDEVKRFVSTNLDDI